MDFLKGEKANIHAKVEQSKLQNPMGLNKLADKQMAQQKLVPQMQKNNTCD